MSENKVGRPTSMTPDIIAKLEDWFRKSYTDEEACLHANIWTTTLYTYCEANPKFKERKEILKKHPNLQAKDNWFKKIADWDYHASKEWLERKSKSEFSLKTEVQQENTNVDVTEELTEEQKKAIAERLSKK